MCSQTLKHMHAYKQKQIRAVIELFGLDKREQNFYFLFHIQKNSEEKKLMKRLHLLLFVFKQLKNSI